jgi:hypothetical protein
MSRIVGELRIETRLLEPRVRCLCRVVYVCPSSTSGISIAQAVFGVPLERVLARPSGVVAVPIVMQRLMNFLSTPDGLHFPRSHLYCSHP